MSLTFSIEWLVFAALAMLALAVPVAWRVRRTAPVLFALAGAAFLLAGARPALTEAVPETVHAVVLDVSGSMHARLDAARSALQDALDAVALPPGHRLEYFDLSDALRLERSPPGLAIDYRRLGDLAARDEINGEVVFMTDGRGELAALLRALPANRLIVLRAPRPDGPDASVLSFSAPYSIPAGGTASLQAVFHCDADAEIPWRLLDGPDVVAEGVARAREGVPVNWSRNYAAAREGLIRLRLQLALPGDREPRNDEAVAAFYAGERRVIDYRVPRGHPEQADALLALLRADATNDVRVDHGLPADSRELEGTALLVINNLPLTEAGIGRDELRRLARWVGAGGSLLMAGAGGAFGPGGYRNTPLEPIMPVRFRPDDAPPRRVLLLLDVSDSMAERLPDGATKVDRLREAALRLLESARDDAVAIAAFNTRLLHEPAFRAAYDPRHRELLNTLTASGGTNILRALQQGLEALPDNGEDDDRRIFIITDGEDLGGAEQAEYAEFAAALARQNVRLDVVLTEHADWPWLDWLSGADARLWSVGEGGFAALLQTLERAIAGADADWVAPGRWRADDVPTPLPLLTRTAERAEGGVEMLLRARPEDADEPAYPLLATRQLIGRTGSLATRTWGDEALAAFWLDETFQTRLGSALDFLLEYAARNVLTLNPLETGAELLWVGDGDAPAGDLRLAPEGIARRVADDRWLLDAMPSGEELRVFDGDRLLQRLPLASLPPAALAPTGDDEEFFRQLAASGVRVVHNLTAWQPRAYIQAQGRAFDLTWLPALFAVVLLLAGFTMRRK